MLRDSCNVHAEERGHHRHRNGETDDDRLAHRTQEEEQHDDRQHSAVEGGLKHLVHRLADVARLVGDDIDLQARVGARELLVQAAKAIGHRV